MPFGLSLVGFWVVAQPTSAPAPGVLAAAADEAFGRLIRVVYTLDMHDGRALGRVFDDLPDEDLAFRRILQKRARTIGQRVYGDGSADVDVTVSTEHVEQALTQVLKSSPALQERLAGGVGLRIASETIVATGIATPPAMDVSLTGTTSQPTRPATIDSAPPGWRHVPEAVRELTADAARADALDRLFEHIKAMPLDAGRTIRTLLLNNPGQIPRCRAALAEAATFKILYDLTGVCVAHLDVPADTARQWLPRSLARQAIPQEVLSATGLAEPPPAIHDSSVPDWVDQTLSVTATSRLGEATPDADLARRAAVALAKRRLADQLDRLPLPDGRSVRDAVLTRPDLADDFNTFFNAARQSAVTDADGQSTVTLALPLRRLVILMTLADDPR